MDPINIVIFKSTGIVGQVEKVDSRLHTLLMGWDELKDKVTFEHALSYSSIMAAASLAIEIGVRIQKLSRQA